MPPKRKKKGLSPTAATQLRTELARSKDNNYQLQRTLSACEEENARLREQVALLQEQNTSALVLVEELREPLRVSEERAEREIQLRTRADVRAEREIQRRLLAEERAERAEQELAALRRVQTQLVRQRISAAVQRALPRLEATILREVHEVELVEGPEEDDDAEPEFREILTRIPVTPMRMPVAPEQYAACGGEMAF